MSVVKKVKNLCAPARFYLGLSVVVLLLMVVQNLFNNNSNELCVGSYKCDIPSISGFFILEGLYILFWTWLLNLLCRHGLKSISWFIVLLPFLLFAVGIALLIYVDISNKNNGANNSGANNNGANNNGANNNGANNNGANNSGSNNNGANNSASNNYA